ncbi:MAG TPA: MoxR family ATPase [Dehalococcoidia bacterium]|jgi:MoxR-like ATPase|nr:MoxR family ATPase [Dehalococcoidia bacterium]
MAQQSTRADPQIQRHLATLAAIRGQLGRVIVGQDALVDRLLIALLTNSHALIEGVPGLAKTLTVSSLAQTLQCSFTRIQFTPDLLPADITGTMVFDPLETEFHVRRGPIFANVVLADEINRAPAKVQSALLEAMQERQVTIGGETMALPDPFLVLATQNPIEHEGTYPLPEAQLDRFMLKVLVTYPEREEERDILRRGLDRDDETLEAVTDPTGIEQLCEAVAAVEVNDRIREYVVRLIEATRDPSRYQMDALSPLLEFGASPRASVFLARAAQAYAFINERDYVVPDDVKALAPDVLRHRLITTYEAEAQGVTVEGIVEQLLAGVGIP